MGIPIAYSPTCYRVNLFWHAFEFRILNPTHAFLKFAMYFVFQKIRYRMLLTLLMHNWNLKIRDLQYEMLQPARNVHLKPIGASLLYIVFYR